VTGAAGNSASLTPLASARRRDRQPFGGFAVCNHSAFQHASARLADAEPLATELRATRFRLAGDDFVVVSYQQSDLAAPASLTSTERVVFSALLAGQSNQQIATSRGRSLRTVANQVAAVFAKLGVRSRAELFAKCG
jgi:DNA-binding NarL/FixJ family response regulator